MASGDTKRGDGGAYGVAGDAVAGRSSATTATPAIDALTSTIVSVVARALPPSRQTPTHEARRALEAVSTTNLVGGLRLRPRACAPTVESTA